MQDVRVRFPLGALVQDVGKPGNPPVSGTGNRGFNSHRPDCLRCGPMVRHLPVKETIAGSTPATAASGRASRLATASVSKTDERKPWGFDSLSFRLVCPWPSSKVPVFQTGEVGSIPTGHSRPLTGLFGDRLMVGRLALNQVMEVRVLLPELDAAWPCRFHRACPDAPTAERLGSNPSECGFNSHSGHLEKTIGLGRQSADHSRSEREMLWVQLPPEPLTYSSSWSSLECSPSCHDGGRGFKSHWGRSMARYANRHTAGDSGQAQTLVIDCGFGFTRATGMMRRLGMGEPKRP